MNLKKLLSLGCLLGIGSATATPLFYVSPQEIASGATFSQPGKYILTDDATVTGALNITGTNVIFDLNGKTVTAGSALTFLVVVTSSNTVIKNGVLDGGGLTGALTGIVTEPIAINNILLSGLNLVNFLNPPGIGINVQSNNTAVRIDGCQVLTSGNGIIFNSGDKGWITNCECSFNANVGFDFMSSYSSFVSNCVANSNGGVGFNVEGTSVVTIKNSSAEENGNWGFSVANTDSQLRGNIAFGNNGIAALGFVPLEADNNYNLSFLLVLGYTPVVNGTQQAAGLVIDPVIDNISIRPAA